MTRFRGCRVTALVLAAIAAPSSAAWPDGLLLQAELSDKTTAAPSTTVPPSTSPPPSTATDAASGNTSTTSPEQRDKSPVSIISGTLGELLVKVEMSRGFNALVASVLGLLMLFNSEKALQFVILAFAALISYNLGTIEVSRIWHTEIAGATRVFIGVEFGALGAFIAYRGYPGVLVGIAAVAGFVLSQHLEAWLDVALGPLGEGSTVFLHTVIILCFVILVVPWPIEPTIDGPQKALYVRFLVYLCPFLGASLVVSSASYLATMLLKHRVRGAVFDDWTCFLAMLWLPSARDVGLFADPRYHYELLHREVQLDRVLGFVGWALLVLAGVCYQLGCPRRRGARAVVEEAAPGLAAPLMAPESA